MSSKNSIDELPAYQEDAPRTPQSGADLPAFNEAELPAPPEEGLYDKALDHVTHAFHIPGGHKTVEEMGKVAGYPGGVISTAVLSGLHRLAGRGPLEKTGVDEALKGDAKGVPQMLKEEFGAGPLTAYGAGLPLQVATDPLTYSPYLLRKLGPIALEMMGKGGPPPAAGTAMEVAGAGREGAGNALPGEVAQPQPAGASQTAQEKANAMADGLYDFMTPVTKGLDEGGRGVYRNGFRKVDAGLQKFKNGYPEHAFSDLAYDKQFLKAGMSVPEMEQATVDYRDNVLGPQYNEIIDDPRVAKNRSTLMSAITNSPLVAKMADASSRALDRPGAAAAANVLLKDVNLGNTRFPEGRNPRQLMDLAKSYSDTARGTAGLPADYMKKGARASTYKDSLMTIAQALRDKVQKVAEEALPGSAKKIQNLNDEYSILKNANRDLTQQSINESRKYPITQADGALGLLGAIHQDSPAGLLELGKRIVKYHNSPQGSVRIGNTMKGASKTGIWDALLREGVINNERGDEQ